MNYQFKIKGMDVLKNNGIMLLIEKATFFTIPLMLLFSFYQFFLNKSVWLDESYLALNFIDKNYAELLKPLDNGQVAPIGFLLLEKIFLSIFNTNPDIALRILPFVSFLGSILIFYKILAKLNFEKIVQNTLTAGLSINFWLLRYSCEIKQYSSDVFISLTIIFLTLTLDFKKNSSIVIYSIVCVLSILFSNISIICITTSFSYLFINEIIRSNNYRILYIFTTSIIIFIIYYLFFIYNHPTQNMMKRYWNFAFLPINPFKLEFYTFLYENVVKHFFSDLMHFRKYWIIPFSIFLLGIFKSIKKFKRLLFLLSFPLFTHLLLSGFKIYPFNGRLIIYLIPFAYIIVGIFLNSIRKCFIPMSIFIIPVLFYFNIYNAGFPIVLQDIKGGVEFTNSKITPEDYIISDRSALQVLEYYQKTKKLEYKKNIISNSTDLKLNDEIKTFFYVGSKNPNSDLPNVLKFSNKYNLTYKNELNHCTLYFFSIKGNTLN